MEALQRQLITFDKKCSGSMPKAVPPCLSDVLSLRQSATSGTSTYVHGLVLCFRPMATVLIILIHFHTSLFWSLVLISPPSVAGTKP